jgi:hypothetical protein
MIILEHERVRYKAVQDALAMAGIDTFLTGPGREGLKRSVE